MDLNKASTFSQRIGHQGERIFEAFLGSLKLLIPDCYGDMLDCSFGLPADSRHAYLLPRRIHGESDFGTDFRVELFLVSSGMAR